MISGFPVLWLSEIVKPIIDRGSQSTPSFSQQHESRVDCNPGKPRRKGRSTFVGVKVNKGLHQGFLEHIFCVLPIVCYSIDLMKYALGMALAQFNKGRRVSGPCYSNQHHLVHGIRFLPLAGGIEFRYK
jgi:hypothetical protein